MQVYFSTPTPIKPTQNANGIVERQQKKGISKNFLSFKSAASISQNLAKKGIKTEFANNDFYARCTEQAVSLFDSLFGRSFLPEAVEYKKLADNTYGEYAPYYKKITFNSEVPELLTMEGLKKLAKKGHHYILPNDFSTLHPATTYLHEFAHCAHHSHLAEKHGSQACEIMNKLRYTRVPNAIGRLITRYKLGNYSLNKTGGMNEFMAERIAQDIGNGLTESFWVPDKNVDVKYSDIFNRRWNYRYSNPQAYLDYFTQQVWNGDIGEARRTGDRVEEYLEALDSSKVPDTVGRMTEKATEKGGFVSKLMVGISGIFENVTVGLDKCNELVVQC